MRLTQYLLKPKKKPCHIGFDRFLGRGRKKVVLLAQSDVMQAKESLDIEEENMLYLRHPYLTFEQSFGHARDLGLGKEFIAQKYMERVIKKTKPDIYLEERYSCLKNTDVWDY